MQRIGEGLGALHMTCRESTKAEKPRPRARRAREGDPYRGGQPQQDLQQSDYHRELLEDLLSWLIGLLPIRVAVWTRMRGHYGADASHVVEQVF